LIILISNISKRKHTIIHIRKPRRFGRRSRISKTRKEGKRNIFCSLTRPPNEIQVWQVEEGFW
jgi:hypothetical protein